MSKQTPMLMESPLTKRVFVVTSYEDIGDGIFEAHQKHDVTEQFDALAKQRRGMCELIERGERISELKSLVRDMWLNSERGRYGTCGACRHECEYTSDGCEIERRMGELGIEVSR